MKRSFLLGAALLVMFACSPAQPDQPGELPNENGGENYTPELDIEADDYNGEEASDKSGNYGDDGSIYWEAATFDKSVVINFTADNATITADNPSIITSQSGANVAIDLKTNSMEGVEIIASGTTANGYLKIYAGAAVKLTLDNLTITNNNGPAINIQSKKPTFIHSVAGSKSYFSDGSSYADDHFYIEGATADDEDRKGAIFSEGNVVFSGDGSVVITGNKKHGFATDKELFVRAGTTLVIEDAADHGTVGKDGIIVEGGYLYSKVSSTAGKALKSDGDIIIKGGKLKLYTTGNSTYDEDDQDTSSPACIKSDSNLEITAGEIICVSTGEGGKGINIDGDITINGGTIDVATSGGKYIYNEALDLDSSPKGVKADGSITMNGGSLNIQVTGISDGSEGLESKSKIVVNGGDIFVYAYDDAINVGGDDPIGMEINGGRIFAFADNNDGIDSNGTLHINGGLVIASGSAAPEEGFDADQSNNFVITGGTIIGTGGGAMSPSTASSQCSVICNGIATSTGDMFAIVDEGGNVIMMYEMPRTMRGMALLFSSPQLKQGSTYTAYSGGTIAGNTENWNGYFLDGTYTAGSEFGSFTQSSVVTTIGGSSGGGGGGPGNGNGGHGPGWW